MPASKKNKENLKKAVGQAYDEWSAKNPGKMKKIARMKMKEAEEQAAPKPKKSRAENKAAVARTLKLLEKQKKK